MINAIVASTSTIHGSSYLEYLKPALKELYKASNEVVFIPYARPSGLTHDAYTKIAENGLKDLGVKVIGLHTFKYPQLALTNAKAIFTGGGNTFQLVHMLHQLNLMETLKDAIIKGTPYLGTSAGSNICGPTMQTTNDMPVVYPSSFKTIGIIPFNINAHYLDPDTSSTHKGETRETRIKEFHIYNSTTVLGLREGTWLKVKGDDIILEGDLTARVFIKQKPPYEVEKGFNFKELI